MGIAQAKAERFMAERFMAELFSLIEVELIHSADGKCNIPGFGIFSVTSAAERQGRNPQTGAALTIPAKKKIKFAPSAALKRKINGQ